MLPFEKCPACAGQIIEQEVNHKVKAREKVVVVKVRGYVCTKCTERFYSIDSVKKFEKVKAQLESFQ